MGHGATRGRGANMADRFGDHGGSQSGGGGTRAGKAAAGRLTRSRARELGLTLDMASLLELGCSKGQKRWRPNDLEPKPKAELKPAELGGVGDGSLASTTAGPQLEPSNRLASNDPTLRRERGCPNAEALSIENHLAGAPWLVHVSSTSPDGRKILGCSGMIIRWDLEKRNAWILTSYRIAYCTAYEKMYDPMPKFAVHVPKAVPLPNNGMFDGYMIFFSERYQLAVLKIDVETMFEMEYPRYQGNPCYGDKVLVVGRDEQLALKFCRGTITCLEEDHFLFLNCKLCPCGIGGLVINDAWDVVGITCDDDQDPTVLGGKIARKCVEMWTNFGLIARPVLGMYLRSMFLLDIAHHERLRCKYGINNGFIVDEVIVQSTAEKHGVRRGNVITSFHGMSCCLPEFEDFLLSIGMASLDGTGQVKDFELEVHDLLIPVKRTIMLPVKLSDGSEY